MNTARELFLELSQGREQVLSRNLFVPSSTLKKVLPLLEYWSVPLPKSTKTMLRLNNEKSGGHGLIAELNDLRSFRSRILAGMKGTVPKMHKLPIPCYDDPVAETQIYDTLKILLPPLGNLSGSYADTQSSWRISATMVLKIHSYLTLRSRRLRIPGGPALHFLWVHRSSVCLDQLDTELLTIF